MIDNSRAWTFSILLALALAVPAALLPLLPPSVRPWNFAAFGAIALFMAARGGRFGWLMGLALACVAKLVSDYLIYRQNGYDSDYLPMAIVYLGLLGYGLVGWLGSRSQSVLAVAGMTLGGSLIFFLVTNSQAWIRKDLPYSNNLFGILESYWMAIPFWRGTLLSDFTFSTLLFGAHSALASYVVPATVPVTHTPLRD